MDPINFKIRAPRFTIPEFNVESVATALSTHMKERILRGINSSDQPAKPLTPEYSSRKTRKGGQPIRDLVQTGELMGGFGVQNTYGNQHVQGATIGWPPELINRVRWNQKHEDMATPSPEDIKAGEEAAGEEFKKYASKIWK